MDKKIKKRLRLIEERQTLMENLIKDVMYRLPIFPGKREVDDIYMALRIFLERLQNMKKRRNEGKNRAKKMKKKSLKKKKLKHKTN